MILLPPAIMTGTLDHLEKKDPTIHLFDMWENILGYLIKKRPQLTFHMVSGRLTSP
jgi:hypothetical protein